MQPAKNPLVFFLFTILILTAVQVSAQITEVGFYDPGPASAWNLTVRDDLAFVAHYHRDYFEIIDISDLENPFEVGIFRTTDYVNDIELQDDLAFVATGRSGLTIVDISDPQNPVQVAILDSPDYNAHARNINVVGDIACVADGDLRIIDVSNPEQPEDIALFEDEFIGSIVDVIIRDNLAYLSHSKEGLIIVDITDPEHPYQVGSLDTPGEPKAIELDGNFAYMTGYDCDLEVIDVSDPQNPVEVSYTSYLETPARYQDVKISGGYAYLTGYKYDYNWRPVGEFRIVDITDPANPCDIASHDLPNYANGRGIFIRDYSAFVAAWSAGLRILDFSDVMYPVEPELVDFSWVDAGQSGVIPLTISNRGHVGMIITDAAIEGDDFSSNFENEIEILPGESAQIDVTFNPESRGYREGNLTIQYEELDDKEVTVPLSGTNFGRELGFCSGYPSVVAVEDSFAYYMDGFGGGVIVNVSDPVNPFRTGYFGEPYGYGGGIKVNGDFVYLAYRYGASNYRRGLQIVDITDPVNPNEVAYFDTDDARGVDVIDNIAFLVGETRSIGSPGLRIIDVSDPENPNQIGSWGPNRSSYDVKVVGHYAYIANGWRGLKIIDITNMQQPVEVGYYDPPGKATSIAVRENLAFMASLSGGLRIIDITDPEHPNEVGYYDTPDQARDVEVVGDYAFVADYQSGLRIINISDPENPFEETYYETPYRANAVTISGELAYVADLRSLRIFDISGFTVRPPEIYVETQSIDFGDVSVGESEEATFQIDNIGNSDLTVSDISIQEYGFDTDFDGEIVISPGDERTITVSFSPNNYGEFSGTIVLLSDDPENELITIDLTGTGLAPDIELSVEELDFGEVEFRREANLTFDISNVGNFGLNVIDITVEGEDFTVEFEEALEVEPEGNVSVEVTYSADNLGGVEGLITIVSDDPVDHEVIINLSAESIWISEAELLDRLTALVNDLDLNRGQRNSLSVKLRNTGRALDRGQEHVSINVLYAFVNHVQDFVDEGVLDVGSGQLLIDSAQFIIDLIDEFGIAGNGKELVLEELPTELTMSNAYPNPFNSTTTIEFGLPEEGFVNLAIFDLTGREVIRLVQGRLSAGYHQAVLNGMDMKSGLYIARFACDNRTMVQKLTLVK